MSEQIPVFISIDPYLVEAKTEYDPEKDAYVARITYIMRLHYAPQKSAELKAHKENDDGEENKREND